MAFHQLDVIDILMEEDGVNDCQEYTEEDEDLEHFIKQLYRNMNLYL